jgi:hypothetical protein
MAALFLLFSQLVLLATVLADKYTVTDEAWFEVEIKDHDGPGQDFRGRFTVALFGETAPMTAMNFAAIAKGYSRGRDKLHYKNTPIHRVVPDFVVQMGDVVNGDGTGSELSVLPLIDIYVIVKYAVMEQVLCHVCFACLF